MRGGSRIYVAAGATRDIAEAGPGPFEALSARKMIESEVAATAARMASAAAIDAIMSALDDMERFYSDREKNDLADRAFHLSIVRDPVAARRAMRAHLERVTRQFARACGTRDPGVSHEGRREGRSP